MHETGLRERLETALGARVECLVPLSVGFGLTGAVATLSDGRHVAVKARTRESAERAGLDIEGAMLADLARLSALPVPHVYVAEPDLLVMNFIDNDGGAITPAEERDAARLLAHVTT